ncbi:MAG: beta-galactosidase trimerization domain-containing protein, partial [Victivallales bacterium]
MPSKLRRKRCLFDVALIITFLLLSFQATAEDRTLNIRHAVAGKAIDKAYHDAGIRVDLARFDLLEAKRQGRDIPEKIFDEIDKTDKEMRALWILLDQKQNAVIRQLRELPATGDYQLSIQSLEDSSASEVGWFILRSAKLVWLDGTTVDIPLKSFRNNLYFPRYSYLCEPSPVVGVYGLQSSINKTVAGFEVNPVPAGDAKLVISGLDCEKPGVTRIGIMINKTEIFKSENPFRKKGWSEHEFPVPSTAFSEKMTAESAKQQLSNDLSDLEKRVNPFLEWAKAKADQVSQDAMPYLKNLVYQKKRSNLNDCWQKHFLRGVCFGYIGDYEHVAKSLSNIDTTLMYGYLTPDKYQLLDKELDKVGMPYIGVGWTQNSKPPTIAWNMQCYVDVKKRQEVADMFFEDFGKNNKSYAGIAFDEPRIMDHNIQALPKEEYAKFGEAFKKHLESRQSRFEKAGVTLPENMVPVMKIESSKDLPVWMEWQLFKKELMKNYFLDFQKYCDEHGYIFFPLVNNQQPVQPQMASYLSAGAVPLVGTDLYNDGAIREGFTMHLLHTCAKDKAIMVPGSGYSCQSADRFRRSLCTGMLHADGILQWVYPYISKYRDPDYFWRTGGKKDDRDDRGRDSASHWKPEYWDIQTDIFRKAKASEPYLVDAKSVAETLILYSERTAIAGSATDAGFPVTGLTTLDYFDDQQGIYSDLVAQSRPLDLCFIEAMTPARLRQYEVAILTDSRVMTPEEEAMIRDWVNAGGSLIASAESSLCDEWGRIRSDFALADIFGVHYKTSAKGVHGFTWDNIQVKYDPDQNYAKITASPGTEVLSLWENGDPALLYRKCGKGQVWFLTMCRPGLRLERSKPDSALFGCGASEVGKLIGELQKRVLQTSLISADNLPEGVEFQLRKTD